MKHHPSTLNPTSRWFNLSVLLLKTKLKGIAMFLFVSVEKRYVSPNVCPYTKCRMVPLLSRGGFVTFVMVCNACVMGKDVVPINWGPEQVVTSCHPALCFSFLHSGAWELLL